jgi:hypothetical protein
VERFAINASAGTATLIQTLTNPSGLRSWCCGSTRMLPGGDWVTAWGSTRYVTEQTSTGSIVFQLTFTGGQSTQRANPVLPGQLSIAALRAGMEAQYPRP